MTLNITNVLGRFFGKYAPLLAGVLLIILGFIEMFN
jgi:putative Mn2+ efflux pump MntP